MKKILYYSDCPFFAGCENMLVNFFGSEDLSSEFELTFLYRYSERYEEGAKNRMDMSRSIPVRLMSEYPKKSIEELKGKPLYLFRKIFWGMILWIKKYYSIRKNRGVLASEFKRIKPDILHINNGGYPAATSCYAAVLAAMDCGISNIVYVVNNMTEGYRHPLRWFDRTLDKVVKEQVSFFVNGSNNAGFRLKSVLKIPSEKQVTIRNGITPRKVTQSRDEFLTQFGIEKNTFVFAEVANLEERKGHRVLLQAVQKMIGDGYNQDFIVLLEGNGLLKLEIDSCIRENNLSTCVKMIEVDQIYNLYNAIDCLVLPSIRNEDFPNTIIEAMGMGVPVIGTSIAGIPEQIEDHVTGLLIKPNDVYALAKAMTEMCSDNELYKFCAKNAKNKFQRNYTAEISVKNYITLYRTMIIQ